MRIGLGDVFDVLTGSAVFFMPSGPNKRSWKMLQRLAFDLLGDEAEQVVVRIVIFELGARFEMCRPIEGHGEYLLRRPHLVRIMV